MIRFDALRAAAVCLLALGLAAAHAADKPAAAAGSTKSFGNGKGNGRLLSRNELRACLSMQASLKTRRTDFETEKAALERDKQALAQEQESLKGEHAQVDVSIRAVKDLNTRYLAYEQQVKDWNDRAKALGDRAGFSADRDRLKLKHDQAALQQEQKSLDAERAQLGDGPQKGIDAFNEHLKVLAQKSTDWNQRNAKFGQQVQALNDDSEKWTVDCADRRYHEDDETAIRNGK